LTAQGALTLNSGGNFSDSTYEIVFDPNSESAIVVTGSLSGTLSGIKFTGSGFAGKTLTLNNEGFSYDNADKGNTANPGDFLIFVKNTGSNGHAAAIDLTGASGTAGSPFTISLDNADGGKEYRFFASSTATSGNSYAIGVGVPYASDSSFGVSHFTFQPNGAKVRMDVSSSSNSSLFGAGNASGGAFNNWTIGNFGDDCSFTATSNSPITLFGAGSVGGTAFNNWTIGNFGDG
jgi:hypothetical protein